MIPFPNISPDLFSISLLGFNFTIKWYALSYIFGFVAAFYVMKFLLYRDWLWRKKIPPIEIAQLDPLMTYLILGVIIGGRLGYVLFYNMDHYLEFPLDAFKIWEGGMAFHGGFLGVILAAFLFLRQNGVLLASGADLIAIATPPGLFFGRIANFINAELWGKPTDVTWGVIFPGDRAQDCPEVIGLCARHPSQLYEAGLEGILLFGVLFLLLHKGALRIPGLLSGVFISGYGMSRFFVEYFRVPDPQFFSKQNPFGFVYTYGDIGLTMGQALSFPMIFVGILIVIKSCLQARMAKY